MTADSSAAPTINVQVLTEFTIATAMTLHTSAQTMTIAVFMSSGFILVL